MNNRCTDTTKPKLFTPNVTKGCADGARYLLYRRGPGLFSITPRGQRFRASYERDACGLGCVCGAYITGISEAGVELLSKAQKIDNMSKPL